MVGDVGVESAIAVLHRVSMEAAGEVDSVSVAPGGDFEFSVSPPGLTGQSEILFASVRYEGVLYFGSPITKPEQLDSLYVVNVFGAEAAPLEGSPLPVSTRNIFLEEWGEGWRVTDLFQIMNETDRTFVAAEGGVVWTYPLPEGATSPELGQGDLPPDAVTFEDERVIVRAPLPPGERMLFIRYELPTREVEFPAPGVTETLEMLVKEPAPVLTVEGLASVDVVALDTESTYRRYSGIGLLDSSIRVKEGSENSLPSMGLFSALLATLLAAAGVLVYFRPRPAAPQGAPAPAVESNPEPGSTGTMDVRKALILQLARVDERLEATVDPDERQAMLEERSSLKDRLRDGS